MKHDTINILHLERYRHEIELLETRIESNILIVEIKLKKRDMQCPVCQNTHLRFLEYKYKKIIHSISTNQPCKLRIHQRRYQCKTCMKTFSEHNLISDPFENISLYTKVSILNYLKDYNHTFTSAAHHYYVSSQTVMNIFDRYVESKRRLFPKVVNIDEVFISRAHAYKYACVLYDFTYKKIIDVLPTRHKHYLIQYFSRVPKSELNQIEVVVMDMWTSYKEVVNLCLPHAKIAVDSFHLIRTLNEIIKRIRIDTMNKYRLNKSSPEHDDMYYYMLKKFHYFFVKNYEDIYDGRIRIQKLNTYWHKSEILNYLLLINDDLKSAYKLKEKYREFNLTAEYESCDMELEQFIHEFRNHKLSGLRSFGRTLDKWKTEIKNSFLVYDHRRISNGPIESVNNKIKTIIKTSNGIKSFDRLRNKIMYSINKDIPIKSK